MTTTTQKKTTTKSKTISVKPEEVNENLPNNPFTFEVLNLVSKMRTKEKKIQMLKKYEHDSLKTIFIWNFDESVISTLPPGEVPYSNVSEQNSLSGTLSSKISDAVGKMSEMGSNSLGSQDQGRSSIRKEFNKFYNFIKGGNDGLSSLRRETMFINILEGLHPLEAEIVCLCKDKKLDTKYRISKEVVVEAYHDITWGGRS